VAHEQFPALLARVVQPSQREALEALQITWLDPHGVGKLFLPTKTLYGDSAHGVVCLGDLRSSPEVVIARHVEDALAAGEVLGLPAIATLSPSRMIALKLLGGMRGAAIALNRRRQSRELEAADALQRRLSAEGLTCSIVSPPGDHPSWISVARERAQ
jgi:hypothetical protein